MNTEADVRRTRVLVVDDDPDAGELIADVVASFGFDAHAALGADQALSLVEVLEPTVALVDLLMPGMDGYELAAAILQRRRAPKLIAISGLTRPEDVERSLASGFVAHLAKPLDLAGLRQTLFSVTRSVRAAH